MTKLPILVLLFCALSSVAVGLSKPRFSEIPDGWLSNTLYTNDALGIRYRTPEGWAADTDGQVPSGLDYHPPKEPTRQCVKVLVSYSRVNTTHPTYKSIGSLFAIDPGCFPDTKFAKVVDAGELRAVAGKMIHAFSKSPYIGPDGADVGGSQEENLVVLSLTGEDTVRLYDESTIHENLLFALTEFSGYWIGWGAKADDARTAELKGMADNIKFWIGPKGKMP
jgi:hypothetical protein